MPKMTLQQLIEAGRGRADSVWLEYNVPGFLSSRPNYLFYGSKSVNAE
jgi:hypothetical protein